MAQKGYVYILESSIGFHKIGCSVNPYKRVKHFGITLPFEVDILHTIETDDMYATEKRLHDFYDDCRVSGEWFIIKHFELSDLIDCNTVEDIERMIAIYTPPEMREDKWYTDEEFLKIIGIGKYNQSDENGHRNGKGDLL